MTDDGEQWKSRPRDIENEKPERIALDEYDSLLGVNVLYILEGALADRGINKTATTLLKSELEKKIGESGFAELPQDVQNAFMNLTILVQTTGDASDEDVIDNKNLFKAVYHLSLACHTYGPELKTLYTGKNPCRIPQFETKLAVAAAEKFPSQELPSAAKKILKTCEACPYRSSF